MAPPIITRPRFPHSQSFPSGRFHKPLILISQRADRGKQQSQKTGQTDPWITALSNSMKLWTMPPRATQKRRVMLESSDKTWSTGEGNGKPLQSSCLENRMNGIKRQKDMTLKDELPMSVGAQYATGDEWRKSSRKKAPEIMKRLNQSKNNTQLWIWLVMEVKSDAVRTILHTDMEC